MKRKTLIYCLCAVAVLVALYAVAVVFLYSPVPASGSSVSKTGISDSVTDSSAAAAAPEKPIDEPRTVVPEAGKEIPVVPEGPFEVRNPSGGKPCSILQHEDGVVEMRDPSGKTMWTLEVGEKLGGRVCSVDYYANGRTQYLFTGGDRLYLVDRLGRVVKGFPVKLKSPVLLGPDVYDFSGAHRYNIMVLDGDNGIEMYNLKGVIPEKWKRISLEEGILGLPEYNEVKGRSYWTVCTKKRSYVYSFYGELVKAFDGKADLNKLD